MLQRDAATGLDHTWFRKYESFSGRWTGPDPFGGNLGNPQSLNGYNYAGNDPVNFIDPSGLYPDPLFHDYMINAWSQGWNQMYGLNPITITFESSHYWTVTDKSWFETHEYTTITLGPSACGNAVEELVALGAGQPPGLRTITKVNYGRGMGYRAKNGFGKGHDDPNLSTDGFKDYLISGGQGADVYKHIWGIAGATLIGDHIIKGGGTGLTTGTVKGQDNTRAVITGAELVAAQMEADKADLNKPKHDEALAEVADDYAAIDVGRWMGQGIDRSLSPEQLRTNIFNRLCDH